jgi:hypothetical protein
VSREPARGPCSKYATRYIVKKTIRINGHPVAMTPAQIRDLEDKATGKRKPKLKRAADRAWERLEIDGYQSVKPKGPKAKPFKCHMEIHGSLEPGPDDPAWERLAKTVADFQPKGRK